MKLWWQTLSARERGLLIVGALATLVTLLFVLVLEPLHVRQARLQAQVAGETASLNRLRALAADALRQRARPATGTLPAGQSLLAVLNTTTQSAGIQDAIARVVPNGTEEASVTFDDIEFDALIAWLVSLREQTGIEANRLVVDQAEAAGHVNASLTLATGTP
jgi:general secretion pathway protein M